MPRIQEYLPETEGAQPVGGVSPNLEAMGELGAGVESLGRNITQTSDVLETRVAGMEAADAQSSIANARAEYYNRIQSEVQSGNFDHQKVLDDYDSFVSDQASTYSTARGKQEFDRAAGRTRGMVMRWAARGQIQTNTANELSDHNNFVNNLTNVVSKDPDSWADSIGAYEEKMDGYKNDPYMGANPTALEKLKQEDTAKLSSAAVLGQSQKDFNSVVQDMIANNGKVDLSNPKYNVAQKMLDSGVYNDHLNAGQQNELSKQIRTNLKAAQTQGQQELNFHDQQQQQKSENWEQQSIPKLYSNSLLPQQVIQSPLSASDKIRWLNMIETRQNKTSQTNPGVYNDLMMRMTSADNAPGHISDVSQLSQYFTSGQLTPSDYQNLHQQFNSVSESPVDRFNEQTLIHQAQTKLAPLYGANQRENEDGQYRLMLFGQALQKAKQNAVANNQPLNSILDPKSKDYFGNNINQYVATPHELLRNMANSQTRQPPTTTETMPGAQPAQQQAAPEAQPVERQTKDGRIALFNPKTKQFIRYK